MYNVWFGLLQCTLACLRHKKRKPTNLGTAMIHSSLCLQRIMHCSMKYKELRISQ